MSLKLAFKGVKLLESQTEFLYLFLKCQNDSIISTSLTFNMLNYAWKPIASYFFLEIEKTFINTYIRSVIREKLFCNTKWLRSITMSSCLLGQLFFTVVGRSKLDVDTYIIWKLEKHRLQVHRKNKYKYLLCISHFV